LLLNTLFVSRRYPRSFFARLGELGTPSPFPGSSPPSFFFFSVKSEPPPPSSLFFFPFSPPPVCIFLQPKPLASPPSPFASLFTSPNAISFMHSFPRLPPPFFPKSTSFSQPKGSTKNRSFRLFLMFLIVRASESLFSQSFEPSPPTLCWIYSSCSTFFPFSSLTP